MEATLDITQRINIWLADLEFELMKLDDLDHLKCEYMSFLASKLLNLHHVKHHLICGYLTDSVHNCTIAPHYWLEIIGSYIVDLRLRTWSEDIDEIPHGVFHKKALNHPKILNRFNYCPLYSQKVASEFDDEFANDLTDDIYSSLTLPKAPSVLLVQSIQHQYSCK